MSTFKFDMSAASRLVKEWLKTVAREKHVSHVEACVIIANTMLFMAVELDKSRNKNKVTTHVTKH